ncbi:hypothetical protein JRQ81_000294 [Phrynocephalus forsythii]|uniref:Uncharacterized protein n=1 Tax=Phrynocephalus forsythii TaxID=171643 RepID=A0A9Q0Y515_9SAUR|nr:hypothetical protein JRQ81_000294 [Phrynocephalus forsythii]
MSLIIRNLQQTIPIRRVTLRKKIEQLRCILGVQKFDLGVICASNRHMQWLNKTYKGKNIPTDVLSFPFHENLKAGELPCPCTPDEYNLGDIFLGVEYIHQQCEEYKEDYNNVLIVTVAHGMCHLLGYKHSTGADWLQMYEKELQVLQALNKLSGTNLQPLTKNHF